MFLLDTDTVIYALKGDPAVQDNLRVHRHDPMYLSTVTMMELYYGAYKSQHIDANLAKLGTLENSFPLLAPGPETVASFGKLKAKLEGHGKRLADLDLIIAVTAITHNLTLISNNQKHFARIPGLKLSNWAS
ncbi:type II toxin-antitoxin system VapC family toxin [Desulfurivibrio dismutans]|uniref:type II toxin-antitoxin system VapC family toxin n=1 Tax=Desulfurivibrio dismutans TaxID=1398908 RepID=UPI0023DB376C|nr:type II toxin-antitoxin system VapC family toxin [Desulfurivibrio alkaliphilus]MDF1613512.1 type II toxin-antitoxin system VapC family toxin [Desulfurivibrio alkaliphilus]